MEAIKIIRDNIPKIAADGGNPMIVKFVNDKEALQFLIKKLDEEMEEFKLEIRHIAEHGEKELDDLYCEMIDVIDVMEAIADKLRTVHDVRLKHCRNVLTGKKRNNGKFNNNVILMG